MSRIAGMRVSDLPTEDQEQAAVIEWKTLMLGQFPELKWLHHCPNGGSRNPAEAEKLKRMGVVPGVSDLFLPVARGGYHGLWIEMKRRMGGRLSPAQKDWLDGMRAEGYLAVRADGAEKACEVLYWYLTGGRGQRSGVRGQVTGDSSQQSDDSGQNRSI